MSLRSVVLGLLTIPFLFACAKKSSSPSPTTLSSTDSFTVAGIAKAWTSGCLAGSEPITGDNYFKTYLTLSSDGTFMMQNYWHTSASCTPGTYHAIYTLYGTFNVGGFVGGSTTMKTLNFTIDFVDYGGSDLMTYGSATRTAYNSNCGGTSPFNGGANATDGGHVNTQHMNCMSEVFPNSGANATFSNVATFSGGVLTLGAYGQANISGSFPGSTLPTSATIPLN